ncbi:MAG: carbonic anhydrase [Planctomycetes bacterium]|nr:carbonic anhydrase [Planctomycetota bacterium]
MQKLVEGIHRFQSDYFPANSELFHRLAGGQNPQALFISCSDSRVIPDLITQANPGDLFVLRNAGNLIPPHGAANQGGEAATIEYAINALNIRDIIVCGHTGCGAMKALLQPESLNKLPRVKQWLDHAEATREIILSQYEKLQLSPEALWKATVEENVLVQLESLRTHPCVAAGLAGGNLKLHGWVYKIETGEVFTYRPERGQFENFASGTKISTSESGSFRFPVLNIPNGSQHTHCA